MSLALIFCLALGTIGSYGSILIPEYELGSLYSGYQGDYAGKYNNYEPRSYAFEYGVSDPHTGDHKNQWETKDKEGTVRGSYSLLEPDGTTRIVDYIADEHGFRAIVKKVGIHGTSVESHGGAEVDAAPQIAIAAPIAHVESQPTIIEEPLAYKSYDGGYEDYTDLKPVVADVYTKPLEYIQAPKAEGLLIKVPDHDEEYPPSYSQNDLYDKVEVPKISLPQEYLSEHYIPQEKYLLPQEKYVIPQEKYVLPQEKYVLPQEKYILPQEKYVLPEEKLILPQEYYPSPEPHYIAAPKQIQEFIVPEYKGSEHYHDPEYKFVEKYEVPVSYHQSPHVSKEYLLPQAPLEKKAYSYVEEQRYNTPKGRGILVDSPKIAYIEAPKAGYNLNVDYHY